jgi:hypothetical protein
MGPQASPRAYGEPPALRWRAVRRHVAVDQAEAGFAFVRLDIEADPATVHQLVVAPRSHQFAGVDVNSAISSLTPSAKVTCTPLSDSAIA